MSALEKLGVKNDLVDLHKDRSITQNQTAEIFGFKWAKRETYESEAMKKMAREWQIERYGEFCSSIIDWLKKGERKIVMDAGCGSAFSSLLFFEEHLKDVDFLGVDISTSVNVAQERFKEKGLPGDFLQCSIMELPFEDATLDLIFSEGVLHHTDSTEGAIKYLSRKLRKGGKIMFYVYNKKAVIREFTDDFIRQSIKELSDQQAWDALESLTKLGKALGELKVDIDVPDDIPYLGIKKGKHDIQRFFYWNVCKLFYREDFSLDEMNHINFDWFRPLNCHRQTPEEVQKWCLESGLSIDRLFTEDAGITVVATKV